MLQSSIQSIIKLQIKQAMEDLFQIVANQLTDYSHPPIIQDTSLTYQSISLSFKQSSSLSFANFYRDDSSDGFPLKRRPLKSINRLQGHSSQEKLALSQIIPTKTQFNQNKTIEKQLDRLQKTLQGSKVKVINPRFQRQKVLLKRLQISKQNKFGENKDNQKPINSQFLQEIKSINEQLYEIFLELHRFCEGQKEQNQRLSQKLQEQNKNLLQQQSIYHQICQKKLKIKHCISQEVKKYKIDHIDLMRQHLSQSLNQ